MVEFGLETCSLSLTRGVGRASGRKNGVQQTPSYVCAERRATGFLLPPIQPSFTRQIGKSTRLMGKMRLAYLCLEATREGQASHAHVHEIIRGLRNRGWIVELYEPAYGPSSEGLTLLGKLLAYVRAQYRLWRDRDKWPAIYIRCHPAAFPSVLWARLSNVAVILEINGPYTDIYEAHPWTKWLRFVLEPATRLCYRMADALIGGTEQLGRWLHGEVGPKPYFIIPNGANIDLFAPGAELDLDLPRPYVVFFGALAPWQGLGTIFEAMKQPSWPENVALVVAGDGQQRSLVQEAAAADDRIIYLGRVAYRRIPAIVANSIAGLVVKDYPAGLTAGLSPLKLYETLACGVPAIVSDLPGQAEIIRQYRCGLVVPMAAPEEVARAVRYLAEHPEEREEMGKRGRRAVVADHSWQRRAVDTEAVLFHVLKMRGKTFE